MQQLERFCFSRILSIRMFHWTRRMPYWRTWSFLAKQIFLTKTIRRFKVVFSSKRSFTKIFLWSREFCLWHPCWKLLPQIRSFFIINQKKMSNLLFFRKKTLLSQSISLDIWNVVLKTPLKTFRQETGNLLFIAQKSKFFGLCQKFLLEVLRSAGHVESLPGSSSFSSEVFADVKVAHLTPLACPFSKNMEVFR